MSDVLQCLALVVHGAVGRTRSSIIAHVQRSSVAVGILYIGLFNNRRDTYDKATICLRHTHTNLDPAPSCVSADV